MACPIHVCRPGQKVLVFGGFDGKRVVQSSEILTVKREAGDTQPEAPATPPGGGGDDAGDTNSSAAQPDTSGARKSRASISPTVSTHSSRASVDLGDSGPGAGMGLDTGRRSRAAIRTAIQCEMDRHSAEMARLLAELAGDD